MSDLLGTLSGLSTTVIITCCLAHLVFFAGLWAWSRRDLRVMTSTLDDFTRPLRHRSVLDSTGHLSDQIDAFLADVNEVLDRGDNSPERSTLLDRMSVLDEKRRYLNSISFEVCYNIGRTMIEAYPLAGVLGTILAIGAALQTQTAASVGVIVSRFGDAIWSTGAGLVSALLLMLINSILETPFRRLTENRTHVRETVARVKRELALTSGTRP